MITLHVRDNDDCGPQSYPVSQISLGRSRGTDVMVRHPMVSRKHARFYQDDQGQWHVSDTGSSNGTSLNGKPVQDAIVAPGDLVVLGGVVPVEVVSI